jgi:rare lipoprotein A
MASSTHIRLLPAVLAVALALPTSAAAQSTGGTTAPEAPPAGQPALDAGPHALLGRANRVTGTVARRHRGRVVRHQRFDAAPQAWRSEGRTTVAGDGGFSARWRPRALGPLRLRAIVTPRRAARVTAASPEVAVTVFRPAMATWYGPGLYGNTTACGQEMTPELLGVAHKKLPCGTPVEISYRGASIVVPVVDRGPFSRGMTWDLTAATAQALGFTETARVGALVAQPAPQSR